MFRELYDNIHAVSCILVVLLLLCVSFYFLVGVITRRSGISLKLLLIGEEYIFALISSIVIFLTMSFPTALAAWLIVFFLMNIFFRNNRRIVSCIIYCEQNKKMFTSRQLRSLSQLNPCLTSKSIISWIKDYQILRREVLYKIDSDIHINHLKFKHKRLPSSILAAGTIGISVALLTYGSLIDNYNSFPMLLLENYAILSCALYALYVLLYFSLVKNIFHYMYGHKGLFKILFVVFSIIMYVSVTVISMNT